MITPVFVTLCAKGVLKSPATHEKRFLEMGYNMHLWPTSRVNMMSVMQAKWVKIGT